MTKETQEVVVMDNAGIQLPAHLVATRNQGSGLTGLVASDYIVPRIKLLAGLSDEVTNGVPGAEAGKFWLTVLDQPLGDELDFVVISNRVRVLLTAPRDDGQGILARADDGKTWDKLGSFQVKIKNIRAPVTWEIKDLDVGKSGLLNFGTEIPGDPQSHPAATKFYDFLVYLPRYDLIAVMSLARSQSKKAKQLISKIEATRVHMNGLNLRAKIISDTDGTNAFHNYAFSLEGYTDEPTFNTVQAYGRQFSTFKMDETGLDGEGAEEKAAGPTTSDAF